MVQHINVLTNQAASWVPLYFFTCVIKTGIYTVIISFFIRNIDQSYMFPLSMNASADFAFLD